MIKKLVNAMKLIYKGDSLVHSILGSKQLAAETAYRLSDFVMCIEADGKCYLYNNFTKKKRYQYLRLGVWFMGLFDFGKKECKPLEAILFSLQMM